MSWEKFSRPLSRSTPRSTPTRNWTASWRSTVSAGHAMIEKMPQLMSRTMAVAQKLMGDIQPEIEKMVKESAPKDKNS